METTFTGFDSVPIGCSQPTYKEWKRGTRTQPVHQPTPFPAYLQGMETQMGITTTLFVLRVPSLPTRNGNSIRISGSGSSSIVPSLPTRNGNVTILFQLGRERYCSQPTYKEWKLASSVSLTTIIFGFPAYLQGMETVCLALKPDVPPSSQPTYKEWKLY